MASRIRRFFYSPVRAVLAAQVIGALGSGLIMLFGLLSASPSASVPPTLGALGPPATKTIITVRGTLLFWAILVPAAFLTLATFFLGLMYGRWGLPARLQGKALLYTPLLAMVYFLVGAVGYYMIVAGSPATAVGQVGTLLASVPGRATFVIYVVFSAVAVALGWSAAYTIADYQRRRGRWETVGYFDESSYSPGDAGARPRVAADPEEDRLSGERKLP